MRSAPTFCIVLVLQLAPPTASMAYDEARFFTTCEKAIKSRQPLPETFVLRERSITFTPWTEDVVRAVHKSEGVLKVDTVIAKLRAGEYQPIDVMITMNYESSALDAQIISKRSYCRTTFDATSNKQSIVVEVDGNVRIGEGGTWIKSRLPR